MDTYEKFLPVLRTLADEVDLKNENEPQQLPNRISRRHLILQQGNFNMRQPNPTLCPKKAQEVWNGSSPASTQVTVECELITPMYGGGVKAGVVDRNMPIRASALRGQLRFWWRLLNSTSYPNSGALFNAESALWGGISSIGPKASQVTLQVKAEPVGSARPDQQVGT